MMKEYKIISGPFTNCEDALNEWRHKFEIKILGITSAGPANVCILVVRKPIKKSEKTIFED